MQNEQYPMPAMTEQHKEQLIGLCKIELKRWKAAAESNHNMSYMVELMDISLAVLTAPPVKLPDVRIFCNSNKSHRKVIYAVTDAIRAAGYPVEVKE